MRILSARGDEPELWLNPVEELVQHQDPSCASIQVRRKVPDVSGPSRATPLERRIAEPKRSRPFPCRAGLVRGERSRPRVGEHHRPTQRDAPESPIVALTDGSCFFEVGFGTLLIDLGCRGIDQAQRQGYQAEPPCRGDNVSAHSSSESYGIFDRLANARHQRRAKRVRCMPLLCRRNCTSWLSTVYILKGKKLLALPRLLG